MTLDEIKTKINKSNKHQSDCDDFVAAAVYYPDREKDPSHSGIIISYDGELFLFHFNGKEVKLEPFRKDSNWYIDKKLDFIESDEVVAFLIHCRNIEKEAKPSYGFNYNGSYFKTDNADYFSEVEDFQLMTCVGFCLNVITGIIEGHAYVVHTDWDMADSEKDAYFVDYLEAMLDSMPAEKVSFLKKNQRRIHPIEYFTTAFINKYPINKSDVDVVLPPIQTAVRNLFLFSDEKKSKTS